MLASGPRSKASSFASAKLESSASRNVPVSWPWLLKAMALPGKALHVGLMLWREAGCANTLTVRFCLTRAAAQGIPVKTARRAVQALERAGLVAVRRMPGRGLEVTLLSPRNREAPG